MKRGCVAHRKRLLSLVDLVHHQRRGGRTSEEKAGVPTQENGLSTGNASKSGLYRAGILRMQKKRKKRKKEDNGRCYKITIPWLHFDHKKGPFNCSAISFAYFVWFEKAIRLHSKIVHENQIFFFFWLFWMNLVEKNFFFCIIFFLKICTYFTVKLFSFYYAG